MPELVIQVVLAPALVAAATLGARRWGERAGGVLSAFPAIAGPVLLVAALRYGTAFAAEAASGTLLGLVALSAFAVAYGRTARRFGWPASLAVGWAVAGATGLAVSTLAAPSAGLGAAAASLALAYLVLGSSGRGRTATPPPAPAGPPARQVAGRLDLPARMALTAGLVLSLTWAAGRVGPLAGGVLAALPVLAAILAVFTHARRGGEAAVAMLRGMLAGMAGFLAFCALVSGLVEPAGIAVAFTAATIAAVAMQLATARAGAADATAPAAADAAVRA